MPQTCFYQTGNEFSVMIKVFIAVQHIAVVVIIAFIRPASDILTVGIYQILQITDEDFVHGVVIAVISHTGDSGPLGQL